MDFNKLNAMVDELDKTFGIIEENTRKLEESKSEQEKEYFYSVHEYFANWARLFEKVVTDSHGVHTFIKPNAESYTSIKLDIDTRGSRIRYGESKGYLTEHEDVRLTYYNKAWFDACYFTDSRFEEIVLPTIQSIDYNYIEKQLMEKLNTAITIKANELEERYNKAIQNA